MSKTSQNVELSTSRLNCKFCNTFYSTSRGRATHERKCSTAINTSVAVSLSHPQVANTSGSVNAQLHHLSTINISDAANLSHTQVALNSGSMIVHHHPLPAISTSVAASLSHPLAANTNGSGSVKPCCHSANIISNSTSVSSHHQTVSSKRTSDSVNVQPSCKPCINKTSATSIVSPSLVDNYVDTQPSHPSTDGTKSHQQSEISIWGNHTQADVEQIFTATYDEIVHWRKNIFLPPSGSAGKKFISEKTKFINFWNDESPHFYNIAIKIAMTMPALLLQKPSYKSTSKQHSACLARRLLLWEQGDFDSLLKEGRSIQSKIQTNLNDQFSTERIAKTFANLMMQGKVTSAIKMLDKSKCGGVLPLNNDTLSALKQKHPDAQPSNSEVLLDGELPFFDPIVFSTIDESTIMKAASRTRGASGPSGMDGEGWKRILVSRNYGKYGTELRTAIARMTRILCTQELTSSLSSLESYIACRLIPLEKKAAEPSTKPGVRPIGIGEVLRRIIGKAVISVIRPDIIESAGCLQLCAGQPSGCEAAAHAMRELFEEEETDAVLFVDAANAFNAMNRQVMLHNIQYICPAMSTYVRNCYKQPARLFIAGGGEISSEEGTTQGDPFAMPVYAVGVTPMLPMLKTVQKQPDIIGGSILNTSETASIDQATVNGSNDEDSSETAEQQDEHVQHDNSIDLIPSVISEQSTNPCSIITIENTQRQSLAPSIIEEHTNTTGSNIIQNGSVSPVVDEQNNEQGVKKVKHAAYADDIAGSGKLRILRLWWNNVEQYGPLFGYYPEATKSWLLVKEHLIEEAKEIFAGTNINITSEGRAYVGGFVGTTTARSVYAKGLVDKWIDQLKVLVEIARSQPQAAYSAFVSGFQHKLTYHIRTIPGIQQHLHRLDETITVKLIPLFCDGRQCSENDRLLLSLPIRLGGLAIPIFANVAAAMFESSTAMSREQCSNIKCQETKFTNDKKIRNEVKDSIIKTKNDMHKKLLEVVKPKLSKDQQKALELSQLKGASSWLNALPLKRENYAMSKRQFQDAICLRYRWQLRYLPTACGCGKPFSIDHAMSCIKGGFIHQRHDVIRDTIATVLTDVCKNVEVEPQLTELTGEFLKGNTTDGARLDISAGGFWEFGRRAFTDVRVFNPFAQKHNNQSLAASFNVHEREKKRKYNARVVEVENGSFTPLVFTPYGGCSRETNTFLSKLSEKLANKHSYEESDAMSWLRTKLSFALTRSAITCIRGTRNATKAVPQVEPNDIDIEKDARIN